VKGVNFVNLRDAGDPVELAALYAREGADELVFLDITASEQRRGTIVQLVHDVAEQVNIPFTVGGGIRSEADVEALLGNGADKVSVNSTALSNPLLIDQLAKRFGSQCVVVAIDARNVDGRWMVYRIGGKEPTKRELFDWAAEVADRGAGELLFTSMDHDGTKNGFACEALAALGRQVSIPIIASGGAGTAEHFLDVFRKGEADAALAASVFHYGEIPIPVLKAQLKKAGIPVRITTSKTKKRL
jgi:cyclase